MNIEYIIPIVTFWHTISTEIKKYQPPAIANNLVSFIHCLSFIGHYNYDYNLDYAIHISIGFYAYDLFFIFSQIYAARARARAKTTSCDRTETPEQTIKKHTPFIVHHIVGTSILYATLAGESREHILGGYIILEKSNIMIYVSYYIHKQYAEYQRLNGLSEFIQLLFYAYYRLIALSLFIYNNRDAFFQFHFTTQLMILGIYGMGFAWSTRLLKRNIGNIANIRNYRVLAAADRSKKYDSAG
jgi:hypothetical protein